MISLLIKSLLSLIEEEFVKSEPELKDAMLAELTKCSDLLMNYVNSKVE